MEQHCKYPALEYGRHKHHRYPQWHILLWVGSRVGLTAAVLDWLLQKYFNGIRPRWKLQTHCFLFAPWTNWYRSWSTPRVSTTWTLGRSRKPIINWGDFFSKNLRLRWIGEVNFFFINLVTDTAEWFFPQIDILD